MAYLQRAPLWQPTVSCAVRFGLGRASDAMPHRRGEPVDPRRPERERLHSRPKRARPVHALRPRGSLIRALLCVDWAWNATCGEEASVRPNPIQAAVRTVLYQLIGIIPTNQR